MFDFKYTNRLKYVTVTDVTTTGDSDALARYAQQWDAESTSYECGLSPEFGGTSTGAGFTVTLDTSDLFGYDGTITWACTVDLSGLDWESPWECRTITSAEMVYHEREPRQRMESDAARFLECCAREGWAFTPSDADMCVREFLNSLEYEAEEMSPDPMGELLAEAMEDARPTSTGITPLDVALGGGLHKGLSVLAGNPGAGKTALAVQAALYAANQQEGRVVYAMADMGGRRSALLRMISCAAAVAGVEGCELGRASEWGAREVYEGRRAYDRVAQGRMTITETKDVADLLAELDRMPESVGFVVLDFAQAMTYDQRKVVPDPMDASRTITKHDRRPLAFDPEAASQAVRALREWAYSNGAVVLLLSAYSKSASEAHARGAKPTMSDILGSAELAYSAEHVLAISNDHDGSEKVVVTDLKSRHGGGSCTLHLDSGHGLFS